MRTGEISLHDVVSVRIEQPRTSDGGFWTEATVTHKDGSTTELHLWPVSGENIAVNFGRNDE